MSELVWSDCSTPLPPRLEIPFLNPTSAGETIRLLAPPVMVDVHFIDGQGSLPHDLNGCRHCEKTKIQTNHYAASQLWIPNRAVEQARKSLDQWSVADADREFAAYRRAGGCLELGDWYRARAAGGSREARDWVQAADDTGNWHLRIFCVSEVSAEQFHSPAIVGKTIRVRKTKTLKGVAWRYATVIDGHGHAPGAIDRSVIPPPFDVITRLEWFWRHKITTAPLQPTPAALELELQLAVAEQRFEDAVRLRDQIRKGGSSS